MKNNTKFSKNERGQAIIIIVFAIIGLIGMTALVVDGTNAYSNRRHAQNAADTASFAAARAIVRDEQPWKDAALNLAEENGYDDDIAGEASTNERSNVEVYGCAESKPGTYAECGEYEGSSEYLIVVITTTVDTTFARVIGIQQITNRVKAIARAKPDYVDNDLIGDAMVSLMQGCKGDLTPNWPHDPFTVGGSTNITVTGSGVFVNSDCDDAYKENGNDNHMNSDDGVCVVGTSNSSDPSVSENCGTPLAYPPIILPNPSCDIDGSGVIDPSEEGAITGPNGGPYTASPGYYSGDFPDVSPAGDLTMQGGVYCIDDDFTANAGWNITSQPSGVLIMVENGGITINGGAVVNINAITDPAAPQDLQNLLFYMPLGNENTLDFNGNGSTTLTGTVLAPSSHCAIDGSAGSTVNSQVMCYTIAVAGGANVDINYDETQNIIIQIPPSVELTQ